MTLSTMLRLAAVALGIAYIELHRHLNLHRVLGFVLLSWPR